MGRRSGGNVNVLLIVGIAVAVVVVGGAIWGYRTYSAKAQDAERLAAATRLIEEADAIVVQVDAVVRSEVTSGLAQSARGAVARVPDAQARLNEAIRLLEGSDGVVDSQGEGLAAAASARLEMLTYAPAVLRLNASAATALPEGRKAWDAVLAADKASDQAVASYNKLNKTGVRQSRELNKAAAAELTKARDGFSVAESAFPEAPFEQYVAYVDARIRLNKLSQRSDAAWLAGDIKKANALIKEYNAEDKRVVALAKTLPISPEKAVADAYETAAKTGTDSYYAARDAATRADERLRAE